MRLAGGATQILVPGLLRFVRLSVRLRDRNRAHEARRR
jgi:hypothetical protein